MLCKCKKMLVLYKVFDCSLMVIRLYWDAIDVCVFCVNCYRMIRNFKHFLHFSF